MDFSQIPPEALQQVMQALGITDPNELMKLAQDNPQIAQQVLSMIMGGGQSAEGGADASWVEGAADSASGETVNEPQSTAAGDEAESDVASPPADAMSASPAPMQDDEAAEGEAPMPTSGRGGTVDDLISAQMMQRATGDPNAAVPRAGGRGKNPRMPLPASGGANQQQMIAELYRQMAARQQQPRR